MTSAIAALILACRDGAPLAALMADMSKLTFLASDVTLPVSQAGWSWMGNWYAMAGRKGLKDRVLVIDKAD